VLTPRTTGQSSIDGFAERSSVAIMTDISHTLGLLRSEVRDARATAVELLSLLGQILDQAIQSLPLSTLTPQNRAAIAKSILACAATGEREPIELSLAALVNCRGATGRRSSSY
jgi:hypothetical protein